MTDPVKQIEDEVFWKDLGKQALLIWRGAAENGASEKECVKILVAFYAGMFKGAQEDGRG